MCGSVLNACGLGRLVCSLSCLRLNVTECELVLVTMILIVFCVFDSFRMFMFRASVVACC